MGNKLIYFPNDDTFSVEHNQWFNVWTDTQLNEPTNQNLIKIPEVVKPTNKEKFL